MYRRLKGLQRVDLFWAGVAIVSMVCFALLTALVVAGRTVVVDHDLILVLRASASPVLTTALLAVTFTSGRLAVVAAMLFAFLLYRRDGWRTSSYYVMACVTAQLLNLVLKYAFHRVRPHGISPRLTAAGGFSYPSADVMMAVVIFGLGALILSRTLASRGRRITVRAIAVTFVMAAAIARVYLGAHWPSDALAGILAGVACSAIWAASAISPTMRPPALDTKTI